MPDNERKLRVFLCHASQDKPVVRELYRRLLTEGWIDPWLDKEKLLPGQDWELEIEKSVESADVVIVCLSKRSVEKEGYYQKEIRKVLEVAGEKPEGTVFIIPLRLDNCQTPRSFARLQYVDYFPVNHRDGTIQRLLKSLRFRLDGLSAKQTQSEFSESEIQPQLMEQMRQRALRSDLLRRMTSLTSSAMTIDEILRFSIQELFGLFDADITAVFLQDEQTHELRLHEESVIGANEELVSMLGQLHMDSSLSHYTVSNSQKPILSERLSSDRRILPPYRTLATRGVDSIIVVPLIIRNQNLGELLVGSKKAEFFNALDLQIISAAASQLALALIMDRNAT